MMRLQVHCMSSLYLVDRQGERVVLKTYLEKDELHYEAEKRALSRLSGERGIVTVYDLRFLEITMKYYPKGDLFSLVAKLNESNERLPLERIKKYARDLLRVVQVCHAVSIAHLDLKLDNILIDDDDGLVLTDFGMAVTTRTHRKQQGTLEYMAPEVYSPHFEGHRYDPFSADMWSFAITVFILLWGNPPFNRPSVECPCYRAYTGNRAFFWAHYKLAADAADFLEHLMVVPRRLEEKRPRPEEVLLHPWLEFS